MKREPVLKPQHHKVMRALAEMQYATYQQLARHGFSPGSYTHVTTATKELIEWGYVAYDFERRVREAGRGTRIITYTKRGRTYCAREMPELFLPFTTPRHYSTFQDHMRGVADLVILARRFANADAERVQVLRVQTDLVTAQRPVTLSLNGKVAKVIPDLWLELTIDGVRRPVAIEYDRGTERGMKGEQQWREKVRKYVAALRGPIQAHFEVPGSRIAIVVAQVRPEFAAHRLRTLLDWTEQELTALFPQEEARHKWGQLFRFAVADPARCSPEAFFTADWWVSPFDPTPRALIAIESG